MKKIIKYTILIVIAMLIYTTWIEPNWLIIKRFEMNSEEKEKIRIVQFTDTQLGDFYSIEQFEKVVQKINESKADIILFTGDLLDRAYDYDQKEEVSKLLKKMKAPLGKFAIWGNHDYGGGAYKCYEELLNSGEFQLLTNEIRSIEINGRKISLIGSDDGLYGQDESKSLISKLDENNYNILLIHEPDLMDEYLGGNIDLAVAGHSHGGQVALPIIGAIVKVPLGKKYTKGFYNFENDRKSKLFVSSGIGSTKLPFRLCNRPEIIIFDI